MFSNDSEPINMFKISRGEPFKLPSVFRLMGPMRTELFIGHLATGLATRGVDVVLYTNGESKLPGVDVRWLYPKSKWPIKGEIFGNLKDLNQRLGGAGCGRRM